jgi:hypothetical protein
MATGHTGLVVCGKCGNEISRQAMKCPKCGSLSPLVKTVKCRSCGKPLLCADHVKIGHSEYMSNGTSQYSTYVMEYACSYCGDPEPLHHIAIQTKRRIFSTGCLIAIILSIFAGGGILLFLYFLVSDLRSINSH